VTGIASSHFQKASPVRGIDIYISPSYRIREKASDNLARTYHFFNKEFLLSVSFSS